MSPHRGHFSRGVVLALRDRVRALCSNPQCRRSTVGPGDSPDSTRIVGRSAHIHAASAGGPRFDPGQDEDARHSIENAIWLCATCADLIDKDGGVDYPAETLLDWKRRAEAIARVQLQHGHVGEAVWHQEFTHLQYVNVPRLLSLAAMQGIEVGEVAPPGGWLHNEGAALVRLLLALEQLLNRMRLQALPLDALLSAEHEMTGATFSFNRRFYTRNGPFVDTRGAPPPVPADWRRAAHLHCRLGPKRLVMVMDPRWFTTTTSFVEFRSGQGTFAGLAFLKRAHPEDDVLLASPIVIGFPQPAWSL